MAIGDWGLEDNKEKCINASKQYLLEKYYIIIHRQNHNKYSEN